MENNPQYGKFTPAGAVRAYCTQCLGLNRWNREAVDDCQGDQASCGACPFHSYRLGKRVLLKVFRRFCLQCAGGDRSYIEECPTVSCPCYPYRYATNPALKGKRKSPFARKRLDPCRDEAKNGQVSIFHQLGDEERGGHGDSADGSQSISEIIKVGGRGEIWA